MTAILSPPHYVNSFLYRTVMVGIGVLVIAASFYDYFFRKNHIKQLLNKYYIDLAMKVDAAVMAKKDLAVLEKDEGHTGADQMVLSRPRGPSNVTEAQIELAMTDRRPSFAPYLDLSPSEFQDNTHDDVIKWKQFPRNWPFVRGIHRSRWIPHTKASDAELWCLLWSASA